MNRASTLKEKEITLYLLKRNLQSLGYPLLICGGSTCLFLRQAGVRDAMFLPEILFLVSSFKMQYFKGKSLRNNFPRSIKICV
jgi:hypothetical protein